MSSAEAIHEGLAAAYPDARCELDFRSPFELLVATVLSAQSTDRRVNSVTPALFARYPTPLALAEAEQAAVEELIGPVGFYRTKATAIIGLSRRIVDDFDGEVPANLDDLVTLPGVGRKTANVVLGNAFDVPGLTPDTHFIRLANRFGWVDSTKPDDVERAVAALFPPEDWVMVSHRLIWHGRRCCHARRPACGACPVRDLCPSSHLGEQDPAKAAALIREPRG
ncbi:endonuclease III [Tessaracoccus flavus]|uniref:Endonuclease III n=1 Tax=Tessaracoccus flavus TaxID=1610493 RepID=A0A1Q2CC01_9ACTN|nr:endonuclease III [Tessaracoccus flavus]AQP43631.1 endonuclease III [Tessaracoccus flavus]SDZ01342.1 DNA-(apurinic or apyrimidinic site) lyase /endonuclease III [Tessaracoccus flavus]